LEALLYIRDISELTRKLEKILLSFYRPFENKILFETLALLHGDYARYNVKEIERTLNVNRKTLARQFRKQIGVSITDYRRILRFRDAVKLHSGTDESLTKLAYETAFSDQSHFIKDMKKLTGDSPKKLFDEACTLEDAPFFLKRI
jgi:AraC-like DNA-binding protein